MPCALSAGRGFEDNFPRGTNSVGGVGCEVWMVGSAENESITGLTADGVDYRTGGCIAAAIENGRKVYPVLNEATCIVGVFQIEAQLGG